MITWGILVNTKTILLKLIPCYPTEAKTDEQPFRVLLDQYNWKE